MFSGCCERASSTPSATVREEVVAATLAAARMIATEGIAENVPAKGFLFIIGDSRELLEPDPDLPFEQAKSSVHSRHGFFPKELDCRGAGIFIQKKCEEKRALRYLCGRENAVVVDGASGQVCCGGFANRMSRTPYGTGARTQAASTIAVNANCVAIKASRDACGSRANPKFIDGHFEVFRQDYFPEQVRVVEEDDDTDLLAAQRRVAAIRRLEDTYRIRLRPRRHRKKDEYAKVRAKISDFERGGTVEESLVAGFEDFCQRLPTFYPVAAIISAENEDLIPTRLSKALEDRNVGTYFHPDDDDHHRSSSSSSSLVEFVRGVGPPRILIFVGCPLDGVRSCDAEWRLRDFRYSNTLATHFAIDFDLGNLLKFIRSLEPECVLLLAHDSIVEATKLLSSSSGPRLIAWSGRMNRRSAAIFVEEFLDNYLANVQDDGLDCIQSSYLRAMRKSELFPSGETRIKLLPPETDLNLETIVPEKIRVRLETQDLLTWAAAAASSIRDTYIPRILSRSDGGIVFTAFMKIKGKLDNDRNLDEVQTLLDDLDAMRVDFEFTEEEEEGMIVYHCVVSDVDDFRGWGLQVDAYLAKDQTIRIAELALTGVIVKTEDLVILRDKFPAECAEAVEHYKSSGVRGERLLSNLLQPAQDLTINAINTVAR